jgi:hypothetical protein
MNFEMFAPGRSSADGRGIPTLRILSGGRLVLNAAAQRSLGNTTFVQLFWDADTGRIGIMPSEQGDPDTFRVTSAPSQSIITSKAFVDAYKLPLSQRMRLAWDGRMWIASTIRPDEPLEGDEGSRIPERIR